MATRSRRSGAAPPSTAEPAVEPSPTKSTSHPAAESSRSARATRSRATQGSVEPKVEPEEVYDAVAVVEEQPEAEVAPKQKTRAPKGIDVSNIIPDDPLGGHSRKRRRSISVGVAESTDGKKKQSKENEGVEREKARKWGVETYDAVMFEQDSSERFLASEFIRLPNRRQFADYYILIKHPVSLETIQDKLKHTHPPPGYIPSTQPSSDAQNTASASGSGAGGKGKIKLKVGAVQHAIREHEGGGSGQGEQVQVQEEEEYGGYRSVDDVKKDFDHLWNNAKKYNVKESQIFKDAQKLHRITNRLYRECLDPSADPATIDHASSPAPHDAEEVAETEASHARPGRPAKRRKVAAEAQAEDEEGDGADGDGDVKMEPDVERDVGGGRGRGRGGKGNGGKDVAAQGEAPVAATASGSGITLRIGRPREREAEAAETGNQPGNDASEEPETAGSTHPKSTRKSKDKKKEAPQASATPAPETPAPAEDEEDADGDGDGEGSGEEGGKQLSLQSIIKAGNKKLERAQKSDPGEFARRLADPFMELPSRKAYPDYFVLIPNPISFKEIEHKIKKKQYATYDQYKDDVIQMCENAKFYNEPESLVHRNADEILRIVRKMIIKAHEQLGLPHPTNLPGKPAPPPHRAKNTVKAPSAGPGIGSDSATPNNASSSSGLATSAKATTNTTASTSAVPGTIRTLPPDQLTDEIFANLYRFSTQEKEAWVRTMRPETVERLQKMVQAVHDRVQTPAAAPSPVVQAVKSPLTVAAPTPAIAPPSASRAERSLHTGLTPPPSLPPTSTAPKQPAPVANPAASSSIDAGDPGKGPAEQRPSSTPFKVPSVPSATPVGSAMPSRAPSATLQTQASSVTSNTGARPGVPAQPGAPPRETPKAPAPAPPPLPRRPPPSVPLIRSFDLAYDVATSPVVRSYEQGGVGQVEEEMDQVNVQWKMIKLRNMKGLISHALSIKRDATRIRLEAYLEEAYYNLNPMVEKAAKSKEAATTPGSAPADVPPGYIHDNTAPIAASLDYAPLPELSLRANGESMKGVLVYTADGPHTMSSAYLDTYDGKVLAGKKRPIGMKWELIIRQDGEAVDEEVKANHVSLGNAGLIVEVEARREPERVEGGRQAVKESSLIHVSRQF